MSRLVLVRHAKSDHPPGTPDHDRPLNERGHRDAIALGQMLEATVDPDHYPQTTVVVSSALRTQETWASVRSAAGAAWADAPWETDPDIYEAAPSTLRHVALRHGVEGGLTVLVGHNPGIGLLARDLSAVGPLRSRLSEGFPTSAIAVLDTQEDWESALGSIGAFALSSFVIPRG